MRSRGLKLARRRIKQLRGQLRSVVRKDFHHPHAADDPDFAIRQYNAVGKAAVIRAVAQALYLDLVAWSSKSQNVCIARRREASIGLASAISAEYSQINAASDVETDNTLVICGSRENLAGYGIVHDRNATHGVVILVAKSRRRNVSTSDGIIPVHPLRGSRLQYRPVLPRPKPGVAVREHAAGYDERPYWAARQLSPHVGFCIIQLAVSYAGSREATTNDENFALGAVSRGKKKISLVLRGASRISQVFALTWYN